MALNKKAMIKHFHCRSTQKLFNNRVVKRFVNIEHAAREKLRIINAAISLTDLREPPGNHLEVLKGTRKGQYSIRINKQWHICFSWHDGHAYDIEIVDYH